MAGRFRLQDVVNPPRPYRRGSRRGRPAGRLLWTLGCVFAASFHALQALAAPPADPAPDATPAADGTARRDLSAPIIDCAAPGGRAVYRSEARDPKDAPAPIAEQGNDWWLFDGREFQLEMAGAITGQFDGTHAGFGMGIGIHYYLSRHFSLGLDYLYGPNFDREHFLNATVRLRVPFDQLGVSLFALAGGGLAMGGGGGGGSCFDGQVGAGVEFRLLAHLSLIVDFRAMQTTDDFTGYAVRSGFSIVF